MTDEEALIEELARIIDPSSWRVMDGYLADTLRKYAGQKVGWPDDQFKHKESMAIARAILPIIARREQAAEQRIAGWLRKQEVMGSLFGCAAAIEAREHLK